MLEEGRAYRARTGKSLMVPRYDIVPIPDHVRENLERQKVGMLAPNSVEMFPAETAQSMFDFRAEEVVGKIAPRPLLLIHAANDSVTPTEQSIEMFKRAGQPDRAASVQRPRSFSVRGEFDAGLDAAAQLARRLFPGTEARMSARRQGWSATTSSAASFATFSSSTAPAPRDAAIVARGSGLGQSARRRRPRRVAAAALCEAHGARRDRHQGAAAARA